jgi:iron complex transport system substrate-binding protein
VNLLFLFVAFVAALGSGCRPAPKPKPDGPARRVVSLTPSTTETMFAIGAGDRLVGRSRYCDWPEEAKKLPQVGGYVDPSFEAILALSPDLVIGARGPAGASITERLEHRGIATFFPKMESFAENEAMIAGVGERVGRADAARAFVDGMKTKLGAIDDAIRGQPRIRVMIVFGLAPLSVAGPGSLADEMIRRAGGDNVVREGSAYPTFGIEHVIELDPDVIVNGATAESMGQARIGRDTPGWAKVRAVAQGKVVAIAADVIFRPGPRLPDGLAALARALHPEAKLP